MKEKWHVFAVVLILGMAVFFPEVVLPAAKKPTTVAELALYKGSDRQQILEEGAKKEGKLTFYTTGLMQQALRPIVDAFEKQYPFIKVEIWRADIVNIISRLGEESRAGGKVCDVVEGSQMLQMFLQESKIAQPFYSPNIEYMNEEALTAAPEGGYYTVAFRGSSISLGYNTKLIRESELPKTYEDLLNSRWKGKMPITGTDTSVNWMSAPLQLYGDDFTNKFAQLAPPVHMVSARALLDMIISGEYALSPTIYDSHVMESKRKGAPVEWRPLEPVPTVLGGIAMSKTSPHPHAALLLIDFELSKKGAEIHRDAGYSPFRKDVSAPRAFKKHYGAKTMKEASREVELFGKLFLKK